MRILKMDINSKLTAPQKEFLRRDDDGLLIFQAGVGSGKTFICSIYMIKHMLEGKRLVAGCLTHSALMKTLFRQCYELAWKWGLSPEINKTEKTLRIGEGIVYGYSSEAADDVLGLTDIYGMILDEASRCSEKFYNNLSDRLRGEGLDGPHKRLITSPCMDPGAQWYNDLKLSNPGCVIYAPLYSNGFVSKKYIEELEARYVIGSPLYRMQVLGEDIPSDYLNAIVKEVDFNTDPSMVTSNGYNYLGMDLSGTGRDETVVYIINSTGILDRNSEVQGDTFTQKNMILDFHNRYRFKSGCLDGSGGFASGVFDNTKHISNINLKCITFSESPSKDVYLNIRAQMYLEAAELIKGGFYIDKDKYPKLVEELRQTQFFIDERGKVRIIPKEHIKKIIGRSPDDADAFVLAVHSMLHYKGNMNDVINAALRMNKYY